MEATEALRGLIATIILTPSDGELQIELKGNLAAMLSAATTAFARASDSTRATASLAGAFGVGGNAKRSPETGDLSLQVQMVAGARNQRYLQLSRGAA